MNMLIIELCIAEISQLETEMSWESNESSVNQEDSHDIPKVDASSNTGVSITCEWGSSIGMCNCCGKIFLIKSHFLD